MILSRLRSYFLPSPATLTLVWAALFVFAILIGITGVYSLSTRDYVTGLIVASIIGTLPVAAILAVAAIKEPRSGPRSLIWGLVSLLVILATLGVLIPSMTSSPDAVQGVGLIFLACCLPVILIPGLLALVFAFKAIPEIRRFIIAARYQRLLEMIQSRGEITYAEAAEEIGLPVEKAGELLAQLVRDGSLMGTLDATRQRAYSATALTEKQRLLTSIMQARGRVQLDELAGELRAPQDLVQRWIYQLVQRGQFHGFVDWENGWLANQDANYLAGKDGCPHCGGLLNLAGKGLVKCEHCGVEIFL